MYAHIMVLWGHIVYINLYSEYCLPTSFRGINKFLGIFRAKIPFAFFIEGFSFITEP